MSEKSRTKEILGRWSCALMGCMLILSVLSLSGCQKKADGYSMGLGVFLKESADSLSMDATAAAVILDSDGRIVDCRIDRSSVSAKLDGSKVTATGADKTGYELGKELTVGNGKYFYEGASFFEGYVKGRSLSDIEALERASLTESLDTELVAGCGTDPSGFIGALKRAMISERKASLSPSEELKVGLGIDASVKGDGEGVTFVYGIGAVAVSDGKVSASVIDAAEAEITLEGGVGKELIYAGTKLELGDVYGMVKNGGAAAEWYVQSANFAKTAKGKSSDSLSSLPVENVSGCTIDARPLKSSLIRAKENTR